MWIDSIFGVWSTIWKCNDLNLCTIFNQQTTTVEKTCKHYVDHELREPERYSLFDSLGLASIEIRIYEFLVSFDNFLFVSEGLNSLEVVDGITYQEVCRFLFISRHARKAFLKFHCNSITNHDEGDET